jgi:hypothetical protein
MSKTVTLASGTFEEGRKCARNASAEACIGDSAAICAEVNIGTSIEQCCQYVNLTESQGRFSSQRFNGKMIQ